MKKENKETLNRDITGLRNYIQEMHTERDRHAAEMKRLEMKFLMAVEELVVVKESE